MPRKPKGTAPVNPPAAPPAEAMTEDKVAGEKDAIAAAFDQAGPGPGAKSVTSTKADPTAPPITAGAVIPLSGPTQFLDTADDNSPTFQQVFTRPLTEHELADKLKAAGMKKKKRDEVELAAKKSNDAFKKEINQLQAEIDGILNQANAGGEEKELTCRKRVDYERAVVTIYDAKTLEILETRQLNLKELQVEMRWAGKVPPGKQGDVIAGPWGGAPIKPDDKTKELADRFQKLKNGDKTAAEAPEATADAPAQAEGEAAADATTAPAAANPIDSFTLPASELDKQSGRRRGRPSGKKAGSEAPPDPIPPAADEGEGESVPAGGIEDAFGGEE